MIKLIDFLNIKDEDLKYYKIHFATGAEDKLAPYNKFLTNEFKEWQEFQTNKNFNRKYVISLIYYSKDIWMFGGVYSIEQIPYPVNKGNWNGWKYGTKLLDIQQDMIGRAFFYFKKEFRASYPCLEVKAQNGQYPKEMIISQILDKRVSISDFPGFDNVNINYQTLKLIIEENILSWKTALSNVKGVYLIVDTKSGKQYVGSAYGIDCLWQRWENYAKNGHGGNKYLKDLLKEQGQNYKYNFKYSVLEVCNLSLGNEYIISRENYWKEVLLTRKFGLNEN